MTTKHTKSTKWKTLIQGGVVEGRGGFPAHPCASKVGANNHSPYLKVTTRNLTDFGQVCTYAGVSLYPVVVETHSNASVLAETQNDPRIMLTRLKFNHANSLALGAIF